MSFQSNRYRRWVVAGSVAITSALSCVPSSAAVTHTCVVLADPAGDARPAFPASTDDGLDMLSVTLSTDGKNALIALQLKNLSSGIQTGRTWDFTFGNLESCFTVSAQQELDGVGFGIYGPGSIDGQPPLNGQITGSFDRARSRVDFSVPSTTLHTTKAYGARDFRATAGRDVGTSGQGLKSGPLGALLGATGVADPEGTTYVYDEGASKTKYSFKHGCDGVHYWAAADHSPFPSGSTPCSFERARPISQERRRPGSHPGAGPSSTTYLPTTTQDFVPPL